MSIVPRRTPQNRYLVYTLQNIKNRCFDTTCKEYPRYGARGISVCSEWMESADAFIDWSLSNGYQRGLHIDRIDNDGDYMPDNCRWTSAKQNMRNRSNNLIITAWGESKCLTEWVEDERCCVCEDTLRSRINAYKWDAERALTTPPTKTNYFGRNAR